MKPSHHDNSIGSRARRLSAGALCGIVLASALAACASTPAGSSDGNSPSPSGSQLGAAAQLVPDSLKNKTINVAVLNDYPPAGFTKDGELVGIGPDMVRAIAADAGLKVNLQVATFDSMIPGLQANRWDFAHPLFQITDNPADQVSAQRRKVLDFVTTNQTGTVFIGRTGSGIKISNASDLCGHSVAVLQGGVQVSQLADLSKQCQQDGKPEIGTQTFGSNNDAVLALSSSRVDLVSVGGTVLGNIVSQSSGKLEGQPFTFAPTLGAIGFAKGSELEPIVTQAIKDLISNGTYGQIFEKYHAGNLKITEPTLLK